MHRSSESIASLAAALAKAQAELVNPEKSLVGTIRPEAGASVERLYRYAPLSSGLDIVRKTLGQHEIATVQTTAIDQTAGTVNLTTMLAHASGEWIASDWPVCAIADIATPRRMGAALTYARRYALFTLVGIAGEDDIDAPDLNTPAAQPSGLNGLNVSAKNGAGNGSHGRQDKASAAHRSIKSSAVPAKAILQPEQSGILRDQLLTELASHSSSEATIVWARQVLSSKNSLTAADARQVEEAFEVRMVEFEGSSSEPSPTSIGAIESRNSGTPNPRKGTSPNSIDKGRLALPEPRRIRDKHHVKFVANQPCLICGRAPADAHHLRFAQRQALGRKVSDEFVVPLCRGHHREVHKRGDEVKWWQSVGIDALSAARALWLGTHPLGVPAARA